MFCLFEKKKEHRQIVRKKTFLFGMILSIEKKDDLKDPEELVDLQSKFKEHRSDETLIEHGSRYDTNKLFESITQADTDTGEKLLKETESTIKAFAKLNESTLVYVKVLELKNRNGVIDTSLIRR